jgi:2-oxoglutarate dehydrogenase complex dehydrogenase (E1) component-like enzyme
MNMTTANVTNDTTIQLKTVQFSDGTLSGTPLSLRVYSDVSKEYITIYQNYETKLGLDMSLAEDLSTKPIYCSEIIVL